MSTSEPTPSATSSAESFKVIKEHLDFVFDCVLIHYGELGLKGLNRPLFERRLIENIRNALNGLEYVGIRKMQGRIILDLNEKSDIEKIEYSLKKVFGIAWFAFCYSTKANLDDIKKLIGNKLSIEPNMKVRVTANRADKTLPFTSMDVNIKLGSYLVEKFDAQISLQKPEKTIFVELAKSKAYLFDKKIVGLYGLPVGASGKILHLLSGGIDSPVAAWLLMKRGCEVDYLHFHAFKKYDGKKSAHVIKLVKVLNQYSFRSKVFFVPFFPFQGEVVDAPARYRLVLFRRFMVRVAERIAEMHGIRVLGSGENLAQVSSQTLENMAVISRATSLPIFRPLLTYDKNETVELAKRIGTFNISTKPYVDCCSIFMAKHPVTKARLEIVEKLEQKLNLDNAIEECLANVEIVDVKQN